MIPDYTEITRRLSTPIPHPAKKRAKPAKTWRRLKTGDRLELQVPVIATDFALVPGAVFVVLSVDSMGANLMVSSNPNSSKVVGKFWRTETPDWEGTFTRVKRSRKGGKKNENVSVI